MVQIALPNWHMKVLFEQELKSVRYMLLLNVQSAVVICCISAKLVTLIFEICQVWCENAKRKAIISSHIHHALVKGRLALAG